MNQIHCNFTAMAVECRIRTNSYDDILRGWVKIPTDGNKAKFCFRARDPLAPVS